MSTEREGLRCSHRRRPPVSSRQNDSDDDDDLNDNDSNDDDDDDDIMAEVAELRAKEERRLAQRKASKARYRVRQGE